MSRRPATRFQALIAAAAALVTACGGAERDAPAPPPIAASKAAPASEPAPTTAPAPAPPPPAQQASPAPAAAPAATPPTAVEPPYTPGTAIPGSIPPSPLPDASAKPADKPADPLKWLQDSQARKADYARRVAEAETNAEAARLKAAQWEKTVLAFKNPYLPRPVLAPEDQQAIAGMGGADRVRWADGKLAEARAASDAAQKALDDLKANPPSN